MSMPIEWTRIRKVAGIAALMVRLPFSSMVDDTTIHMNWTCCFLPFKGRLMPASPNNSSKSEQDDRKGRPYYTRASQADSLYSRDDPCGHPALCIRAFGGSGGA